MIERDSNSELTDDEAVSALIDGVLTDAEARALRKRLASEPELAARLSAFESADTALRSSYGSAAEEPLPAAVVAMLQPRPQTAEVVALERPARSRGWWVPSAIAASIALAVGLAIGVPLGQQRSGASTERALAAAAGAVRPGDGLYALLDSVPSGETRALGAGVSATPRFTFRTAGGGYCRQIDVSGVDGRTEALACREDDVWTLRAAVFEPQAPAAGGATVYRPASRLRYALDAAVDALIDGQPLDPSAESSLIASRWAADGE